MVGLLSSSWVTPTAQLAGKLEHILTHQPFQQHYSHFISLVMSRELDFVKLFLFHDFSLTFSSGPLYWMSKYWASLIFPGIILHNSFPILMNSACQYFVEDFVSCIRKSYCSLLCLVWVSGQSVLCVLIGGGFPSCFHEGHVKLILFFFIQLLEFLSKLSGLFLLGKV